MFYLGWPLYWDELSMVGWWLGSIMFGLHKVDLELGCIKFRIF